MGSPWTLRAVALTATTTFFALAGTAPAAEVTRESYRQAADPICKVDTQANERIFAGVRQEVRNGKLARPAAQFAQAARELKMVLTQLEALPSPAADQLRLSKWFGILRAEAGYFEAISRKLRAGQAPEAERLVIKLIVTATRANVQVLPFEFTYCKLEPASFT